MGTALGNKGGGTVRSVYHREIYRPRWARILSGSAFQNWDGRRGPKLRDSGRPEIRLDLRIRENDEGASASLPTGRHNFLVGFLARFDPVTRRLWRPMRCMKIRRVFGIRFSRDSKPVAVRMAVIEANAVSKRVRRSFRPRPTAVEYAGCGGAIEGGVGVPQSNRRNRDN